MTDTLTGFTPYEYRTLQVAPEQEPLYKDTFANFGWIVEKESAGRPGTTTMALQGSGLCSPAAPYKLTRRFISTFSQNIIIIIFHFSCLPCPEGQTFRTPRVRDPHFFLFKIKKCLDF